jgi:predicted esterase YcpF (UPF0227 family)
MIDGFPHQIYYIHGYLSSPDGTKAQLLQRFLDAYPITYRSVPAEQLVIKDCLKEIARTIQSDNEPCLIGSSLGGLLAAETALHHDIHTCILLNPAIIPPYVDVSKIQDMPQRILQEMKDESLFTKKIDSRLIILLGTEDEVVPNEWGISFAKSQEAEIHFYHDDHRFSRYMDQIPSIVQELL